MKTSITIILMLVASITLAGVNTDKKPNIVLIYADDLGYGDVSCYNPDSKIPTPNIDALAKTGIQFTNAHSSSTICAPSRYGILTGCYSWRTNVKRDNPKNMTEPWIPASRLTIASLLKKEGYNTASIGKWHLGAEKNNDGPKYYARTAGFTYESILGFSGKKGKPVYYPTDYLAKVDAKPVGSAILMENGVENKDVPLSVQEAHLFCVEQMIEYIDACAGNGENAAFNLKANAPFFMYYNPLIPHWPHAPAKQFIGMSGVGKYGDFICEFDWIVGQIMTALERNNMIDNTIVIFASDNGPEIVAYPYIERFGHRSAGNFRGAKRSLYHSGHVAPFIISFPGKTPAGIVSDRMVSQTDILATIADYIGADYNHKKNAEDSFSFLDELIPDAEVKNSRDIVIGHSAIGQLSIQKGDWVYIHDKTGDVGQEPQFIRDDLGVKEHNEKYELFNIARDPKQTTNVINDYPDKANELRDLLIEAIFQGRTASVPNAKKPFMYKVFGE